MSGVSQVKMFVLIKMATNYSIGHCGVKCLKIIPIFRSGISQAKMFLLIKMTTKYSIGDYGKSVLKLFLSEISNHEGWDG